MRNKNIEIRKKLYFSYTLRPKFTIRVNGTYQKRMRRDYLIELWSRFDSSKERVSFDFNFDARIDVNRARNTNRTVYYIYIYMYRCIEFALHVISVSWSILSFPLTFLVGYYYEKYFTLHKIIELDVSWYFHTTLNIYV